MAESLKTWARGDMFIAQRLLFRLQRPRDGLEEEVARLLLSADKSSVVLQTVSITFHIHSFIINFNILFKLYVIFCFFMFWQVDHLTIGRRKETTETGNANKEKEKESGGWHDMLWKHMKYWCNPFHLQSFVMICHLIIVVCWMKAKNVSYL